MRIERVTNLKIQCLQSSLAQDGGTIHWQHCITDLLKTLKTLIKMSQELPALFEIVLRPIWWAAGCEQPSPPLHPAAVAGLLRWSQRCCCCSCSASGFLCSKHTIFPNFFANHISYGQSVWLMALVSRSTNTLTVDVTASGSLPPLHTFLFCISSVFVKVVNFIS